MNRLKINEESVKVSFDKISKRHYIHGKDFSTFGTTLQEAIEKFKTKTK